MFRSPTSFAFGFCSKKGRIAHALETISAFHLNEAPAIPTFDVQNQLAPAPPVHNLNLDLKVFIVTFGWNLRFVCPYMLPVSSSDKNV